MAAERETVDRLIAHHLADRIGATFEGRISGVDRAGLFIKLAETGADGFVPAAHHRRRLLPLRRGPATPLSATARARPIGSATSVGSPRRGGAGGGRAALRAPLRRPHDCQARQGRRGAKPAASGGEAEQAKTPRAKEDAWPRRKRSRKDGRGGKAGGPAPPEDKASREKTPRGKITPRVKGERARRRNDEKRVETHSWSPLDE